MSVEKLLERIGFTEPIKDLDINLLKELCISFVSHIPYETLDIFGGEKRILTLDKIYDTVVNKKRGGLCFELNILFHWLLTKLGFKLHMCSGFCWYPKTDSFGKPMGHMVLLVEVENEKWLTDVGWGGISFVFPLNMNKLGESQSQPNGVYKLKYEESLEIYTVEKRKQLQIPLGGENVTEKKERKDWQSRYQSDASWTILFGFNTDSRNLNEFEEGFAFAMSGHPFTTQNSTAVLQDRNGRRYLIGNKLIEKEYIDPMTIKVISIKKCNDDEIKDVLKQCFGIHIDFDLKPKSVLYWQDV